MNQDSKVSFEAIDSSQAGDGGVKHGALLSRLCEAMFSQDPDEMASLRDDVIEAAGADVLVDAIAVSANFYMMTRIADATGTPLDVGTIELSAEIREIVGVNDFMSRREASH